MENEPIKHTGGAYPKVLTKKTAANRNRINKKKNRNAQANKPKNEQVMENDLKKMKEELKLEYELVPKLSYEDVRGPPQAWYPFFSKSVILEEKEQLVKKSYTMASLMRPDGLKAPVGSDILPSYFAVPRDQAVQTDPSSDKCPLCNEREEARHHSTIIENSARPSFVDPQPNNARSRDVAVEAPDRALYRSQHLTYFRFGNCVYRGWTYRTPDGRLEHVPRVPRGIPLEHIRLRKPVRSPASR